MELLPSNIVLCKVSYNWYQAIKANFITNGSYVVNCWYPQSENQGNDESLINPPSGSLSLFVTEQDGRQFIVGGGFFLRHELLDINSCWIQYGIRCGCHSFNELVEAVGEFKADINDLFSCYILSGIFMFVQDQYLDIPDNFAIDFATRKRKLLSSDDPLGLYIRKTVLERRSMQLEYFTPDCSWPGIYVKGLLNKHAGNAAVFNAQMLSLYDFKCCITGSKAIPVLDVVNIRSLYDDRYLSPDNAMVMRADFQRLFSLGLISAYYKSDDDLVLMVSNKMKNYIGSEYSKFDGRSINLPVARELWPNKEYLQWHMEVKFENWLKSGEFTLADKSI